MSIYSPKAPHTPAHTPAHTRFRSFQSPTSDYLTVSSIVTGVSKDPKAQLYQRWQDLSNRIFDKRLSRYSVIALNRNLDEIENLLAVDAPELAPADSQHAGLGIFKPRVDGTIEQDDEISRPAGWMLDTTSRQAQGHEDAAPLLERITNVVEELRHRQEEFKHLHNVAIAKAEEGAQRILSLEAETEQLEAEIADDQSELTYLKLKLRILEIQAFPYVPTKEKDSLAEGIRRWKLDWADVDGRFRARRLKRAPDKHKDDRKRKS